MITEGSRVNSEEVEYETSPKQVLTHVALCGLEETQTRFSIGSPEEYVHGHTLSIMLTQKMVLDKKPAHGPSPGPRTRCYS